MFRYSYKVEIKRLEVEIKQIELGLEANPNDEILKKRLELKQKELTWFKSKVKEGKGLNHIIL